MNAPVNVIGQVFAPGGGVLQQQVRLEVKGDNGLRPPEYIFTDSNGRFVIYQVTQLASYTITVETDEKNWATTVTNFLVSAGRRPSVEVYLRPLERTRGPKGSSVSVASMQQDVPEKARKQFDSAVELIAKGESAKARPMLEQAIELYPDFIEARNELSVMLMKEENLPAAEAQLRRALAVDATAVRPLLNLGLCLFRQEKNYDAMPFLEKAVQLEPENARAHMLLGMVLVRLGDDHRAAPVLTRAYDLGGRSQAKAQYYLAQLYARQKSFKRAAKALETYLQDVPDDPNADHLKDVLLRLRASSTSPAVPPHKQ